MRLHRIQRALDAEDWTTAMVEAEELLDEQPLHLEGLQLLGRALRGEGSRAVALLVYQQLVDQFGDLDEHLYGLADARFHTCDLPGCVEVARELVRRDGADGSYHFLLARALEHLGGHGSEAVSHYTAAYQLDPEVYRLPLPVSEDDWNTALELATERLIPALQAFWEDIPVYLVRLPPLERLLKTTPPRSPAITGLYLGDPPELEEELDQRRPEGLEIYTDNLLRILDLEEMVDELQLIFELNALDWLGLRALEDLEEAP
ncbi:MAG: hypothetical protein JXX28_17335 [Deltaproteobacteria bacterium]|nr:hypothetical protein [Deltaproteobacteria bacterium]